MFEVGVHELKVMNCLLHPESLDTVVSETGYASKVVLDVIRNLVHYRYLKPVDPEGRSMTMFSPDKLRQVRFMLTAKGLKELENQKP